MTAIPAPVMLAAGVLCLVLFVRSAARHDRQSDGPLRPFSGPALVESLWIGPGIGLTLTGIIRVLWSVLS